jgi:cobalamin biosynthesis protein CobD/CbiB
LATIGLGCFLGLTAVAGDPNWLVHPVGVVAGIVTAVALEALFVRYPRTIALWERRGIPLLSLCALVAAGVIATRIAPWLIAVPVWGLVTYLVLLGCVLLGVENPVSILLRSQF